MQYFELTNLHVKSPKSILVGQYVGGGTCEISRVFLWGMGDRSEGSDGRGLRDRWRIDKRQRPFCTRMRPVKYQVYLL